MKIYNIHIITMREDGIMEFRQEQEDNDIGFYFSTFLKVFTLDSQSMQKNDIFFKRRYLSYVESHKNELPWILGLEKMINTLIREDEYFYVEKNIIVDTKNLIEIKKQLILKNSSKKIDINLDIDILDNYNFKTFNSNGKEKFYIGETKRSKRVCRFCGCSMPTVKFKKTAHAISESLNNKIFILNEECDSCNEKFGNGIENDLITYLSPIRALLGIKGKKSGFPKLKDKNLNTIYKREDGQTDIFFQSNFTDEIPKEIKFKLTEKISLQNIYRVFIKYTISFIDNKELKYLKKTIDWINEDFSEKKLPHIKHQRINSFYSEKPSMTIFIRKIENQEFPHIFSEFRYAGLFYIFIVPFSSKDNRNFLSESDFSNFWSKILYAEKAEWHTMDLSNNEKNDLIFTMKI